MAEIERLDAKNVIVLGGDVAIEDSVIDELESAGLNIRRIAGEARFETAALIASEVSPNGADQVAIANGMDFPDALSLASHAAKEGMPILLTMADSAIVLVHHGVPASVEDYINENDVVRLSIFGGDVAVDLEIEHDLERLLP